MWNSLRFRLSAILIGLAIGPVLLFGAILGQRTYNAVRDQTLSYQVQVAQSVSLEVEKYIQSISTDLNSLGNEIQNLNNPDQAQLLSAMLNAISSGAYQNNYNELILLNNQGQEQIRVSHDEIFPSNQLSSRAKADEFTKPFANHQIYYSPVQFDSTTGNAYMTISIPLYALHSVKLSGVLIANLRFSAIGDLIAQVPVGEGQTIYITNLNGELVAHQDHSVKLQGSKIILPAASALQTGFNGTNVALGVHKFKIGDQEFRVVAERPSSDALALANSTAITLISILLAAFVVSIFFVFLSVRQIVFPIEGLAATAKLIQAGDFSQQAVVRSKDEIGVLANAFNSMTSQLRTLIDTLELRVADRTKALTTSSEVSRRISSVLDKGQLAAEVVEQLQTAFHYYHAHIYLMDESGKKLVMTGGTGEVGKTLLERGHSIPRGRGLVGRAAESKKIVLVPDTRADPNWLPNSLLPETKSEIAVPIITGDQVFGVLDVQNNVAGSLNQQDADLLSSIADQTAIALQNIRSTEEVQRLAKDYKDLIENSPAAIAVLDAETGVFIEANKNALDLYDITQEDLNKVGPIQLSPTQQPDGSNSNSKARALIAEALKTGHTIFEWTHQTSQGKEFLAEIRLVRVTGTGGRTLLNALMTDITEQRRLEEASRKRAIQQEALNTITQKIQNTTTIEAALQIAAREIGHAVGMKTTLVTLDPSTLADNERKVVSK